MTQVTAISYGESGIDLLHRNVITEALHDSVERFPEPACHPGTRTEVLEELRSWSTETNTESTLLWMHGSAGMGKSAIAQMFAGDCESHGRLGASFFFRRNHPRRGKWNGLIATIAYQLANTLPRFLLPLQQAVERDKLVIGRSMTVQFQRLLLEPFTQVTSLPFMPVVIIDGLDECEDHKTQQQILRLFIDAVQNSQLPIHLLITSRPEPHLREALETAETFAICHQLVLSADNAAYEDIRTYFRAEFSRIHSAYGSRGIDLGTPWPSTEALDHLVAKSTGIFVYATTVTGFINDEYSHPEDRLASVLRLDPHSTTTLDDLYTEILSILSPEPQNLRILHSICRLYVDPEETDTILRLRPGTCRLILRGLHSLLVVPRIRTWYGFREHVKLLHASFADYLADPHRSGSWCFSIPWLHFDCLESVIRLLFSPPLTFSARVFHSAMVANLSKFLSCTPSMALVCLMRSLHFQDSIFLNEDTAQWPQDQSQWPPDLVQLWEDNGFICALTSHLELSGPGTSPTYEYDSIYANILSKHAALLFVLKAILIGYKDVTMILCLDLTWSIFKPLLVLSTLIDLPFPHGDSPLDFLVDPRRSGILYSSEEEIAEEVMLFWIQQVKGMIMRSDIYHYMPLSLIDKCQPNQKILGELQNLNLSHLCTLMREDRDAHQEAHTLSILRLRVFQDVLDWLWKFPDPPLAIIAFWERQREDIQRCIDESGF
ncbi:hypothetical protein B0H19DRAFT_713247 [Mycena capillaripes]|nr:hypothetical protein B0H19DRAFT_713247 [Mycena capillaripes]